jgi:hypothetical protein
MDFRRRFIFRGNAAAIGGRIVRPSDTLIESGVASSLTVAGGKSSAHAAATRFGEWVAFGSAATSAEGVFDDVKQHIERTYHRVREDVLTTSTRVHAELTSLIVEGNPKLTVKRLHASMISRSPTGSGEPAIAIGSETTIDGVEIDGHGLTVELAVSLFQKYDTRSKLLAAADDPRFVAESGDCLFMKASFSGTPAPPQGRLVHSCGTTYATIVKSIRWTGEPFPGATIDHHSVIVPNFGKIFFGELLVTDLSRRLTMLRLELGSPVGGDVACAEVESNGTWSN